MFFLNNMWKTQYLRNIVIDKPLSTMYATNNSANWISKLTVNINWE